VFHAPAPLARVLDPLRRHHAAASRGQSLVEFALVLPVILFLTLIALDFGRVYLGYINLQNMARIASNFAANNPEAWGASPDLADQDRYRNQILADATTSNCQLPQVGGSPVVPDPVFVDGDGDGDATDLGDRVSVVLRCTFGVITPGISNVLGSSVAVSASAEFPVKAGMSGVASGGAGPIAGNPPNAAFTADGTVSPGSITVVGPTVDVEFRDTSGGNPTGWAWNFADGVTSTAQDPLQHTFTCAVSSCSFIVSMKASNAVGSSTAMLTVVVLGSSDVNFTSNKQAGTAPLAVTFTDTSTTGGTAWEWTFGDGGTATTQNASHTYFATGTYAVGLTVTYPSPIGPKTTTKNAYITVAVGTCSVPKLNGVKYNDAQATWNSAGFTGTVSRDVGAGNGNFTITSQSIVYSTNPPSTAVCNSNVVVK
jgi:PKD repeat protein